jgi:hypothetical protein
MPSEKAFILKDSSTLRKKQMLLESNKDLGGIGAELIVIGVLPLLGTYSWKGHAESRPHH